MDKSTHEIRLAQWKQIITQCQNRPKGQTAKQWLADNQINEKSYYYWLRKVRRDTYNQLDNHPSVPMVQEKGSLSFAEIPAFTQHTEELPSAFQAAAIIKTAHATMVLSDTISDRLLARLLQEVSNA